MGICIEVGPERYMSNRLNEVIVQPGYTAGVRFQWAFSLKTVSSIITVRISFDVEIPAIIQLGPCLEKGNFQNPVDASQSAFDYVFGASFFDWMKQQPATLRCFELYMAGRRVGKPSWLDYYPIGKRLVEGTSLNNAIFMVDIGGGQGHDLKSLSDKYSDKGLPGRLILQDLVADMREDDTATFESMVHNFFEPQPVKGRSPFCVPTSFHRPRTCLIREVDALHISRLLTAFIDQGARVYHLRAILHDWPTPICRTILGHIVDAMTPNYSKLIIRDFILSDTNVPLYSACTDIRMMLLHGGMERTESQWKELLNDVGLELEGFWTVERGGEGVIEAVKRAKA